MPAPEDLEDVPQRRAVERRHDPDLAGQRRERALSSLLEETLRLQLALQLLEGKLQRAAAVRIQVFAYELIFPFRLVHAQPAPRDDLQAVLDLEPEISVRGPEHHGLDLRAAVLEGEIDVPRVPDTAVGDLSFDPELPKPGLERCADAAGQL